MLKKITWPSPIELNGSLHPATQILTDVVMVRDYWRSSFELVSAADAICDELVKDEPSTLLTRDQHEKLIAGMKLENQNIGPQAVTRYYFKMLKAVHTATDEKD